MYRRNKDKNFHRYAVRGKGDRERERDRMRKVIKETSEKKQSTIL